MEYKTVTVERVRTKGIPSNISWITGPFVVTLACSMQMCNLKAVFSYAMTVMDKFCGWEDDEKWVGSKIAARMWIYTKGRNDRLDAVNMAIAYAISGPFGGAHTPRSCMLTNRARRFVQYTK